ncbi:MAG: hypothetical protein Q8R28_15345 [Dehalococcoidia bacterium]|nr:hypothetical protein [Dehalococcoidia bacterium]
MPRDVIAHAARQKGMTVDEFTSYYDAMWLYDGAEGAYLTFVPKTA